MKIAITDVNGANDEFDGWIAAEEVWLDVTRTSAAPSAYQQSFLHGEHRAVYISPFTFIDVPPYVPAVSIRFTAEHRGRTLYVPTDMFFLMMAWGDQMWELRRLIQRLEKL